MKRAIFYFLIVLGSIWLGVKIYQNPGYILIMYQQYAIETTAWFVVLLISLAFLLSYFLVRLLRRTIALPKTIEKWWLNRRHKKGIKLLNKGYCEYMSGKLKKSEKHLVKSAKNPDLALIDFLMAAQVADEQGLSAKREKYLVLAEAEVTKKNNIVGVMRAKFLLTNNQPADALSEIIKLREAKPRDPYLLKLLAQAYVDLGDYTNLQPYLSMIRHKKVFTDEKFQELEKTTYLHLFNNYVFANYPEVQMLWNKTPRYLHHDTDLLIAYAEHLKHWNRSGEAEELIRKELNKNYSNRLLEYYATTQADKPAKQFALGEKWLRQNPGDPIALRSMAMLCLQNRLWGQARDYLELISQYHASAQTYLALGYVYEKLGENDQALNYYRKGRSLSLEKV